MSVVATVTGPVDAAALGVTLSHEHLFINRLAEFRGPGVLNDEAVMLREVQRFAEAGGGALWDLTTASLTRGAAGGRGASSPGAGILTRDPENVAAIQRISRAAGVAVVLGTGLYRDPYIHRESVDELGVDGVAELMIRDIREGFPGTDVRAGIIGEIGADKWYVSALEERSFRAAARAALATGLSVYTHGARWQLGFAELDILTSEGLDPRLVAIGHVDTVVDSADEYALALLDRGCYVGLDTVESTEPSAVALRVEQIMRLVRAGHLERLLLSHDVCATSHLHVNGGHGLTFVTGLLREELLRAGLDEGEFDVIVRSNPTTFISR